MAFISLNLSGVRRVLSTSNRAKDTVFHANEKPLIAVAEIFCYLMYDIFYTRAAVTKKAFTAPKPHSEKYYNYRFCSVYS